VAGKRIQIADDQIGFDFDVPVVATSKRGRHDKVTSDIDLTERPQTRLKLLSLGAYLPVWFAKISNLGTDAYYLDLFAGPGVYQDGIGSAKGSPVIACEAAAAVAAMQANRGRTWRAHLRFVEPHEETRKTLAAELARFDGIVDYRILAQTAETSLTELLEESVGAPTLAFIDPFGYDIDHEMITAFARPGINEVLVSFDAHAIKRNIAAGQTVGITAFSGGDWWKALVRDGDIDLDAYLHQLCARLRARFAYAGVQQFEFLDRHAHRAVAQCCGSIVGRKAWISAVKKSRNVMQITGDFFPEIDRCALVDEILDRLRGLAGQSVIFRQMVARLEDLAWDQDGVDQGLAFLHENGLVTWVDRTSAEGRPYRLYSFSESWPAALHWDGATRAVAPRAQTGVAAGG
jgi:three-Cys-motif partner protein